MNGFTRSLLIASLVVVPISVNAECAPPDTKEVQARIALITQMETDRVNAGVRKDFEAISAVTAEDYLQIDLDGVVRDKTAAMRRIQSAAIQLKSNTLDQMVVRIYGDMAVVTARSRPEGVIDGRDFPPIRYSRVYVKRAGRWQVVMFQMTRITDRDA